MLKERAHEALEAVETLSHFISSLSLAVAGTSTMQREREQVGGGKIYLRQVDWFIGLDRSIQSGSQSKDYSIWSPILEIGNHSSWSDSQLLGEIGLNQESITLKYSNPKKM